MSDDTGPTFRFEKVASIQTVSSELLSMGDLYSRIFAPDTRTEDQKAADWTKWEHDNRVRREAVEAEHAANLALCDTQFQRDVLTLHGPQFTYGPRARCEGCDMEGYECEAPEWPCRTYVLAAESLQ